MKNPVLTNTWSIRRQIPKEITFKTPLLLTLELKIRILALNKINEVNARHMMKISSILNLVKKGYYYKSYF
jgi:hypothetical protein